MLRRARVFAAAAGCAAGLFVLSRPAPVGAESAPDWSRRAGDPERLHGAMKALTDAIVHDIFSPPVASRIYAYAAIAAHETLAGGEGGPAPLADRLHGLARLPAPAPGALASRQIAAVVAHLEVSRVLVFSEDRIAEARARLLADYRRDGVPENVLAESIGYGEAVGGRIVRWAAGDLYRESRSFPRYTPLVEPGRWVPTPPEYLDAVEPHWPRIRTLVLAAADEVRPAPPPPFATDSASEFHRQASEVYEIGRGLDAEREAIARFWDCNPFAVELKGHLMLSRKRASPGAHWIAVAAIAARQTKADLPQTARLYAATAVALFDAFIACWDEKYRSHLIRPETYINRYLDVGWRPLLQTPPFPEYPSGHSVVSNAAAEVLTALLGDSFAYSDTSEVEYGLPARNFGSFRAAASEAAISRLYGGIHYRAAIENGSDMGRRVGALVVERLALPTSASRGTDRAATR